MKSNACPVVRKTSGTTLFRWSLTALLSVTAFIAGCGPTHTPGTEKLQPEQLALLHIAQHGCVTRWEGQPAHISSIYVDDEEYEITRDRDFYILPGSHMLTIYYERCAHDLKLVTDLFDGGIFVGPFGRFSATFDAGRKYTVAATTQPVGKSLVQTEHRLELMPESVKP